MSKKDRKEADAQPVAGPSPIVSQDELAVLKYLVGHRCLAAEGAKRWEAMERDLGPKLPNLESVVDDLASKGLVAPTKKGQAGKTNYYAVPGPALRLLKEHGLWSPGRTHRL